MSSAPVRFSSGLQEEATLDCLRHLLRGSLSRVAGRERRAEDFRSGPARSLSSSRAIVAASATMQVSRQGFEPTPRITPHVLVVARSRRVGALEWGDQVRLVMDKTLGMRLVSFPSRVYHFIVAASSASSGNFGAGSI